MASTSRSLVPLAGVAFIVLGLLSFLVVGEPRTAGEPTGEIVEYYVENKNSIQAGAFLGVAASLLLIFFGAHLREVLRAAAPDREMLSLVSFAGLVVVGLGFAIDITILFGLSEAAGDIDPVAVQALQALWDNVFVPQALGVLMFLWATGLAVVRTGVLPRWLGWVMIALGVIGLTPAASAAPVGAAILVPILSVLLSARARSPVVTG
jgi:hypothetical protein